MSWKGFTDWILRAFRSLRRIVQIPVVIHGDHLVSPAAASLYLVTFRFVPVDFVLPEGAEVITDPELIELWAKMLEQTRMINERLFGTENPDAKWAAACCRSLERPKLVKIPAI